MLWRCSEWDNLQCALPTQTIREANSVCFCHLGFVYRCNMPFSYVQFCHCVRTETEPRLCVCVCNTLCMSIHYRAHKVLPSRASRISERAGSFRPDKTRNHTVNGMQNISWTMIETLPSKQFLHKWTNSRRIITYLEEEQRFSSFFEELSLTYAATHAHNFNFSYVWCARWPKSFDLTQLHWTKLQTECVCSPKRQHTRCRAHISMAVCIEEGKWKLL